MSVDVKQIGEQVANESPVINRIRTEIHKVIVGQEKQIRKMRLQQIFLKEWKINNEAKGFLSNPTLICRKSHTNRIGLG